jgi:hypothetical protein
VARRASASHARPNDHEETADASGQRVDGDIGDLSKGRVGLGQQPCAADHARAKDGVDVALWRDFALEEAPEPVANLFEGSACPHEVASEEDRSQLSGGDAEPTDCRRQLRLWSGGSEGAYGDDGHAHDLECDDGGVSGDAEVLVDGWLGSRALGRLGAVDKRREDASPDDAGDSSTLKSVETRPDAGAHLGENGPRTGAGEGHASSKEYTADDVAVPWCEEADSGEVPWFKLDVAKPLGSCYDSAVFC